MNFSEKDVLDRAVFEKALPPEWPHDLGAQVRESVQACGRKLVVLDDDPTGGQTVHGLQELLMWDAELLERELQDETSTLFVLTNTRSMPSEIAAAHVGKLAEVLAVAAAKTGRDFDVLVRGDSTLRGHYPLELDAVRSVFERRLEQSYDGTILCPFFFEGGRLSAGDIHWVAEGERLVPAAQTEFARDATFGYRRSDLKAWVEEKTGGAVRAEDVLSVPLELIRGEGPEGVCTQLSQMRPGCVAVVNAVSYRDIQVFTLGLLATQEAGLRFLLRTSASFVKVRSGVVERALLTTAELSEPVECGGLVAVGSYVDKTTRQLNVALALDGVEGIELGVEAVLSAARDDEIARVARAADTAIAAGQDAVIYTSRTTETAQGKAGDLHVGERVSAALVEVVGKIGARPRFFIAKGGITSSDVATHGLQARSVNILGQILPGVPVWQLGAESRFPGMAYVVFPGNVGTDESLAQAIEKCRE
ncbi:MAG: four-carbon acid sugar kinase family protein [Candidatus Latescibacterota bacterium]|jgi:uncharacterized protein YgbK (DUF1537 family)